MHMWARHTHTHNDSSTGNEYPAQLASTSQNKKRDHSTGLDYRAQPPLLPIRTHPRPTVFFCGHICTLLSSLSNLIHDARGDINTHASTHAHTHTRTHARTHTRAHATQQQQAAAHEPHLALQQAFSSFLDSYLAKVPRCHCYCRPA